MSVGTTSLWKNGMLLAASLATALLLAEAVARLFISAPPVIVEVPRDAGSEQRLIDENRREFRSPSTGDSSRHLLVRTPTGLRLRANASVRIRHFLNGREIEFQTNSLGYRNREIGPKSLFRVLFLGDSITGGDYLEEEESFVRQVEARSRQTGFPLETINAAVGAISLANELAILEETGLSTEPDAVVLGFYLNDFNESYGFRVGRLPGWLNESYVVWLLVRGLHIFDIEFEARSAWTNVSLLELREDVEARFPPQQGDPLTDRHAFYDVVSKAIRDWGGSFSERLWHDMSPLFLRFRQLADEHGFEPLIIVFPVALQVMSEFVEDYPQRRLKEIAGELDVPVLDLLPILRTVSNKKALFYDHCHYTPLGNQRIAAEILEFIGRNTRLPRGEVSPRLRADSRALEVE